MSWSRLKSQALADLQLDPEGGDYADFVELMKSVADHDVPWIVARIQTDRAKPEHLIP